MIIVGGGLMKKVYLDNIPRNNKGNIDWGTLKDYQVYFTYNEINDYLIIKEVIGEMLTVSYHGKEGKISQTNLKRARLYNIVKGINNTYSFKYEIGKTVTTNEGTEYSIIGRYKNKSKMYTIKCENCNVAYDVTEAFVNRKSRPICCSKRKVAQGVNDLKTTHPHLLNYLVNEEDGELASGSLKRIKVKCPFCEYIKEVTVNSFVRFGMSCDACSDGFSFPNKIMLNILRKLDVSFHSEFTTDWLERKRFDFLIPSLQLIIEMDGEFHYQDTTYSQAKEVRENDMEKEIKAIERGYKIIRIECLGDFDEIMDNILNSEFSMYFPQVFDINREEIHSLSLKSICLLICELKTKNPSFSSKMIADKLDINVCTVIKYLKVGNKLGLCNYSPKEEQKLNRKKIFVYDKIDDSTTSFNSIAELERNGENLFNVKFTHIGEIASSMSKGRKTPYKNRFFFAYDIPQLQRLSERTSQ